MAVEHHWHDHPLRMVSVLAEAKAQCFLCLQPLSEYNYKCLKCNSFLHISCLKLPLEATHPLHQNHPLSLLPHHQQESASQITSCSDCKLSLSSGFIYTCKSCPFSLHLQCASKSRDFKFEIHRHPLTFLASPQCGYESSHCYVCGTDLGYGFILSCKKCQFLVHIECSSVPVTAKRGIDPFIIVPTRSVDDDPDEVYCDVCEELVNPNGCIYYCKDRVYISHLGCLTSAPKPHSIPAYKDVYVDFSSVEYSNDPNSKTPILSLPYPESGPSDYPDSDDELTQLRRCFRELRFGDNKAQSSQGNNELKVFEHFTHNHNLVLNDDHEKDNVTCYGCWEKISGMAYSCKECRFYLHRWCAELPNQIRHQIHPKHTLTLLSRAPNFISQCDACDEPNDGFTYKCKECNFSLHSMCASMPTKLYNRIHEHPLFLQRKRPYSVSCQACGEDSTGIVFQCEMCNLALDFKCALLPFKVNHKCHVDPLILTYVPFGEDWEEFYCDACEKLRDPKKWVYHCPDCEYSAHMGCVVSELLGGLPSKGLLEYDHYEHLLSLITKSSHPSEHS